MGEPVADDLRCPVEHRENGPAFGWGAFLGLAVTDLHDAVAAELGCVRVAGEVDGLQVSQFVESHSVGVGDLEHHGVSVGWQPALFSGVRDNGDLVVGMVEEVLQLLFGERALLGILFVVLDVSGGVPREEHLRWVRAESLLAYSVPAVVGIGDVGAEQPKAVLIAADCGLAAALDTPEVGEEFLDDGRCPRPGVLIGVGDEPPNQADTAVDGVVVEVAAQLLVAPAVQHFLDGLDLRMQQRNGTNQEHATALVDGQFGLPGRLI